MSNRKILASLSMIGAAALLLSGCASGDAPAEEATSTGEVKYPEVHELVPQKYKDQGHINNMMQIPNAPLEFEDESGTLSGIDPTLIEAVSEVLGVPIKTETTADFAALLPSLDSGRADIIFSAVLSTDERRAAGYSFVDYFHSFTTFMFRAEDADKISTFEDLCGLTVTADKGTQYPELAAQVSDEHCIANGKPAIEVLPLDSIPQQITQLQQGRSDAQIMGVEYQAYEMTKNDGEFQQMDAQLDPAFYGIVARGENEDLLVAIQAALQVLADEGRYQAVLSEWGLESAAVQEFNLLGANN